MNAAMPLPPAAQTRDRYTAAHWCEDDLRKAWEADVAGSPHVARGIDATALQSDVARIMADGRWRTLADIKRKLTVKASDNSIRKAAGVIGCERDARLGTGGYGNVTMWRLP